jgi:hypothetical protein
MPESPSARGAVIALLATALAAAFSLFSLRPPAPVPASAPAGDFSSDRAMDHVRRIAVVPHPTGSPANAAVREYILSAFRGYGLDPQVQETVGVWRGGRYASGAMVRNIVARLSGLRGAGSQHGKAVLLVGHYDSVPTGPGAGDDGHSVGVLLETLRALRAGPALTNDVIFLLTDGEEIDMLGAAAFVNEHPWAADAAVVLNFEARGTGGPAHMFETSEGNGWLIRQFAQAAPYPRTDSVSYEVYRRLPNDTDLTVFKRHGYSGLNFAFIDNVFFYHTAFDDVAHLGRGTVQQQGSYALSLARQFGNADLSQTKAPDVVYFTVPGRRVVVYSKALVWPLTLLAAVVLAAMIAAGLRRRSLTIWGLLRGLLAFVLAAIAAPAAVKGLWWVIGRFPWQPSSTFIQPYNWRWYEWAFIALTVAIVTAVYGWFRRRTSLADLAAAALVAWMVILLATCIVAPLASYLLTWPLLVALLAFWTVLAPSKWQTVCLSLAGVVAAWMLTPYIHMLFVALTVAAGWLSMALLVMLLGLLLPAWIFAAGKRLPIAAAVVCILLLGGAALTAGFTPQHPRPAAVCYALDSASGRALWFSDTLTSDPWIAQFIPENSPRAPLPGFLPFSDVRQAAAPALALAAPEIEILDDKQLNGSRSLTLHVRSARQAPGLVLIADPPLSVRGFTVNGRPLNGDPVSANFLIKYFVYRAAPPEGIQVQIDLAASTPVHLRVLDSSDGIPGTHQPRPPNVMRAIVYWPYNETTVVGRDFDAPAR